MFVKTTNLGVDGLKSKLEVYFGSKYVSRLTFRH